MAQLETWIKQDLKEPLHVRYLSGNMFTQDNAANLVGVEVFDDGEPATLGGSVSANVVRSDGGTVAVSGGTLSGNKVSVILPQAAYAIPGAISIIIKLTTGGTVTTLGAIVVIVYRSSTDAVIDPGTIIPSVQNLISQIETAVASIPADYSSLWTSLAPAFSNSTAYTAGQYVTYDGHLYRFTVDHAAGSFVNTDCTQVDIGVELSSLKSAIIPFNVIDSIALTKKETRTINGVTYTWNGDACTISGETAGTGSYYNFIPQEACSLYGIIPGQKLDVKVTSDVARLHIRFLNGATTITGAEYYLKADAVIDVPATATNVLVRFWVSANKTVNETVEPQIITGITNNSIKEFIDQFNNNPFIERNYLPSGSDVDNATENGWRVLSSGFEYTHSPINGRGAMLYTYASDSIPVQIMIGTNTNAREMYTRNGRSGSFVGRAWVSLLEPLEAYKTDHKYVAFGDSLTYGAVWSSTQGTELHQVKNEWRIPTRIAIANGFINQYQNEAIGGIGYFKKSSGQNLIEQIENYSFTGVDLVTIMAGANDKSTYTLGTKDDTADMETICGAIRNIIQTISGKNPKTQIIVIQPPPSGVNGNTQDVWSTIPTGWKWSTNQFDEQVSQLCHDEHVGYLNWWDSTYCRNWKNVGYNGNTGPNYTHPTEDYDYCMLGDFIAGKVASLYHTVTVT